MSKKKPTIWELQFDLPADLKCRGDSTIDLEKMWVQQALALISFFEFLEIKIKPKMIKFPDYSKKHEMEGNLLKMKHLLNQNYVLENRELIKKYVDLDKPTISKVQNLISGKSISSDRKAPLWENERLLRIKSRIEK